MRALIVSTFLATMFGCGLFEDAANRLDSSEAEAVCQDSCDRQRECDDQFDVASCKDKCGASAAAWYLCPDAPQIANYIEMCNELSCDEVQSCLDDRPNC